VSKYRPSFHLRLCIPVSLSRSCSQIMKHCALTDCHVHTPNINFYFTLFVKFWQMSVGLCSLSSFPCNIIAKKHF
jgi:hypothetical protein